MTPDLARQLETVLAGLVPAGMACAVTDPQRFDTSLMPSEVSAVTTAQPQRKTEFVAGRRAARRAMADLGLPPAPVPAGPDRAPIWPKGLIGSISHTKLVCVAAVARAQAARAVGIDVEAATPLEEELIPSICTGAEAARISGSHQQMLAKRIFSAKEAAYKAQYPLTQTLIGFEGFEVTLDLENSAFTAIFTAQTGGFPKGAALNGHSVEVAGNFLSLVVIDPVA